MHYSLAFENTGDTIPFDAINQEILDFYIDQLNQQNLNRFHAMDSESGRNIFEKLQNLQDCVRDTNVWLYDLIDAQLDLHENLVDYLDQRVLNKLHADWAQSLSREYDIQTKRAKFNFSGMAEQIHDIFPDNEQRPLLGTVLSKLNLARRYNAINDEHVHVIEQLFNQLRFAVSDAYTVICDNHFDKTCLTNHSANISLTFNHLGRTLYDKFINFDNNLEHDDENSYDQLLGYVTVSLMPVQNIPYSKQYTDWCRSHSRQPIGSRLNIGNLPNLFENLFEYRKIILRNLLNCNKFTIQNTRG